MKKRIKLITSFLLSRALTIYAGDDGIARRLDNVFSGKNNEVLHGFVIPFYICSRRNICRRIREDI